ncbi:DNA -binding domain-containing protein [Mesorhizobium helmanticense]
MRTIFPSVRVACRSEIFDQLFPEPDIVMKYTDVEPGPQDEVPWSERLTAYDKEHFKTYLRFLDASAADASSEEMAQVILGIDPAEEPVRARKAARSHLDRANWMMMTGYSRK